MQISEQAFQAGRRVVGGELRTPRHCVNLCVPPAQEHPSLLLVEDGCKALRRPGLGVGANHGNRSPVERARAAASALT